MKWLADWRDRQERVGDLRAIRKLLQDHLVELENSQKKIPQNVFVVTRFLLQENIDTYNSIITLYKKRDYRSCLILTRSIIENSVNLQYIYKEDLERRALNYKLYSAKTYLDRIKDLAEEDNRFNDAAAFYEEELKKYSPSGNKPYHWDGKNIKRIFDDLGQGSVYEEFYSRLSSYIHAQYKNSRDLETKRPYNNFLKKLIHTDCAVIALESLKSINNKYNLLEGGVFISDYPDKGEDLMFFINDNTTIDFSRNIHNLRN